MGTAVLLVLAVTLPSLVGAAVLLVIRLAHRRPSRRVGATTVTIERTAADLRRLRAQLEALEEQPPGPGRGIRMRALRTAYGDTLGTACALLGLTPPRAALLDRAETYRVESALREQGLDVRPAAMR